MWLSCGGEFAGKESISGVAQGIMGGLGCCERSFHPRELGVVVKVNPMGTLRMVPTGWPDHLPEVARWAQTGWLESHLIGRTRKFTLLSGRGRGFRGAAAERWNAETDRQRQLPGVHHPGGKCRRLFGAGGGPTEAGAEAKQERDTWKRDARRCKAGLHEPAKRTKICTKTARLALGCLSVSSRSDS